MQHLQHPEDRLRLANERIAALIDEPLREHATPAIRQSIRRSIGHSIIRIGERLAAEPSLGPAQPSR